MKKPSKSAQSPGLDKPLRSWLSHFLGWMSPSVLIGAYLDWLVHISFSPDKQIELVENGANNYLHFLAYLIEYTSDPHCARCTQPRQADQRFQNPLWNQFPYNFYSQLFLINEKMIEEATTEVRGVSRHHENLVNFTTRQWMDMMSPSNFPWMNPEVIDATVQQSGANFIQGFTNWLQDLERNITKKLPIGTENFKVGKQVAITPGKVVYRNHLIELIQYEPTTDKVYPEPVLFIPAWIMKYYILDLSPENSMVKYLVEKGHTVFMISWLNPDSDDRDLTMEDYVNLGIMDALATISSIIPHHKVHTVGYCIGGTLLMLAAAALAQEKKNPIQSITLFAAQVDFKDAGELLLFIDEGQISYLEDLMWEKGYLDGKQMAGTFSMLRSVDLIWSKNVIDYQLGTRRPINDLMAWDYDTTRLPYAMHSEYLRKLFLNNDLVEGHYSINGKTLSLLNIDQPIFVESAIRDHVAPWKSVYKLHFYTHTEITFVLTSGGHNSGVVNVPGLTKQRYQISTHHKEDKDISPELWQEKAKTHKGSWWPAWQDWLMRHSGRKCSPPPMGKKVLCKAPGTYVLKR